MRGRERGFQLSTWLKWEKVRPIIALQFNCTNFLKESTAGHSSTREELFRINYLLITSHYDFKHVFFFLFLGEKSYFHTANPRHSSTTERRQIGLVSPFFFLTTCREEREIEREKKQSEICGGKRLRFNV